MSETTISKFDDINEACCALNYLCRKSNCSLVLNMNTGEVHVMPNNHRIVEDDEMTDADDENAIHYNELSEVYPVVNLNVSTFDGNFQTLVK